MKDFGALQNVNNIAGILLQVLNQTEARYNSADMNIAYRMNVDEYQRLCPYAEALEENWGKPPGVLSEALCA